MARWGLTVPSPSAYAAVPSARQGRLRIHSGLCPHTRPATPEDHRAAACHSREAPPAPKRGAPGPAAPEDRDAESSCAGAVLHPEALGTRDTSRVGTGPAAATPAPRPGTLSGSLGRASLGPPHLSGQRHVRRPPQLPGLPIGPQSVQDSVQPRRRNRFPVVCWRSGRSRRQCCCARGTCRQGCRRPHPGPERVFSRPVPGGLSGLEQKSLQAAVSSCPPCGRIGHHTLSSFSSARTGSHVPSLRARLTMLSNPMVASASRRTTPCGNERPSISAGTKPSSRVCGWTPAAVGAGAHGGARGRQAKASCNRLLRTCVPGRPAAEPSPAAFPALAGGLGAADPDPQAATGAGAGGAPGLGLLRAGGLEGGWDLTTPAVAMLAAAARRSLLLQQEGFCLLAQKEWLSFRPGFSQSSASHLFLQFLDCLRHIHCSCPTEPEFSQFYPKALTHHPVSSRFRTLLLNSERVELGLLGQEKRKHRGQLPCRSVWEYVGWMSKRTPKFYNDIHATEDTGPVVLQQHVQPVWEYVDWMSKRTPMFYNDIHATEDTGPVVH
ncbi:Myotubularin-related protein 5 [Plecturocebus cupreus]